MMTGKQPTGEKLESYSVTVLLPIAIYLLVLSAFEKCSAESTAFLATILLLRLSEEAVPEME